MKTIHLIQPTSTRFILTASILGALTFTACERKSVTEEPAPPVNPLVQPADPVAKTTTLETGRLGVAIDTFEKAPTAENHSSVNLALAQLDGEIAELEDRVVKTDGTDRAEAAAKLDNLKSYRDAEKVRFAKVQVGTAFDPNPPADSRSAAQKLEDTVEKVGDKIEEGAKKVGETIEEAAKDTGEAVKDMTE
jgi:hypothetical protein